MTRLPMEEQMTKPRIQSFGSLRDEMIAVAKGERAAPVTSGEVSVHSAEVLARLLTPQNRELMTAIRDKKPSSIAELAKLTHRAAPNVVRTLDKFLALGLIYFQAEGRSKAPRVFARKITIEIDPYSSHDVISLTPAGIVNRSRNDRRSQGAAVTRGPGSKPRVAR
jgi:predicted transcriptional regulator